MLGAIRRNKNNPVVMILLGIVALLMVGFGVSIQGVDTTSYAAKVNGETITQTEFISRYSAEYDRRQRMNPKYDRQKAKSEDLRRQILDQLITMKLLAQQARKMGLQVDDQALADQIVQIPDFQVDGAFDPEQYQRVLRATGRSELVFEDSLREQMLAEKLLTAVLQGVGVSDAELQEAYRRQQAKIDVEYVTVMKSAFDPEVGTVTAADVEAWASEVEDLDGVVKDFYKRNKSTRFDVPKKACARHVLVRVEENTAPDLAEKKKDEIAEAAKKISEGTPFEQVAAEYSEDANKNQGGSLGCFAYEDALPEVAEAAFGLEPGEVSPIVKSGFGYHVVKVDRFQEPVRLKLDDVREDIKKELTARARADRKAKALAQRILDAAKNTESLEVALEQVETDLDLSARTTGPFSLDQQYFPDAGGFVPELSRAAWNLTPEDPLPDEPVETQTGFMAIRLKSSTEADAAGFESKKSMLENMQVTTKMNDVFEGWQQALQENAKVKVNPSVLRYGS